MLKRTWAKTDPNGKYDKPTTAQIWGNWERGTVVKTAHQVGAHQMVKMIKREGPKIGPNGKSGKTDSGRR